MDRRTFLKLSLATGALAGLDRLDLAFAQDDPSGGSARALIAVSNAGGGTDGPSVSLIDPARRAVLATLPLAGAFSFPATRWAFERDLIWSGLPAGPNDAVRAFRLATGEEVVTFPTGSSQNYTEISRDGRYVLVAARFEDTFYQLGADPDRSDFGAEVARLATYEGASPCDVTIHPDGVFAYVPDRGGDTLSVLRLDPLERVQSVQVANTLDAPLEPYMATVSPTGRHLLVENAVVRGGSQSGSESIFDLSDPADPVEVARLGPEQGMGLGPLTSEITPDGRWGLVVCRDSSSVAVIDMRLQRVETTVELPEGSNPLTGTFVFGADDGDRAGDVFFVPLPGRDAVAAISVPEFEILDLIAVGARPQGAVYLRTRVPERAEAGHPLGVALASGRTFPAGCPDPCCGAV